MSKDIVINEIFGPTCQGEGPNVGARCIFVRVQGCSYRCSWCDTKQTWDKQGNFTVYEPYELARYIVGKCFNSDCYHVVLTGGNPCLYDFNETIEILQYNDIVVDIETQGDLYPGWLKSIDTVVFSPKAPSSGMKDTYDSILSYIEDRKYKSNQNLAIKIPVFNDEDIEFARKYARFVNAYTKVTDVNLRMYLSVGNTDVNTKESIRDRVLADYETLLNKINENPEHFENVYILPQLHTLVWGNKQGV